MEIYPFHRFLLFLSLLVISQYAGGYFVLASGRVRNFLLILSFWGLSVFFKFFSDEFVFLHSKLHLFLFVLLSFSFNFFLGLKSKKKIIIYFFIYCFPYIVFFLRIFPSIPEIIATPIFLYVRAPVFYQNGNPKLSGIRNIRVLAAKGYNEIIVDERDIIATGEKINFKFSLLPKICKPGNIFFGNSAAFEEKIMTDECYHKIGTLFSAEAEKQSSVNEYYFMFFPREDYNFMKKVFLINEFEFVMNFNNYMFHFDAKKGALSFIGEGEILFACPAEDIISITKETENGIISLPHIP